MSSTVVNSETTSPGSDKPVLDSNSDEATFPPFPDPTDDDFDEISEEEKIFYKKKFKDLNAVKHERLHCTACDRHMGCVARNESKMRMHPMLRTLVCQTCHSFYNSGEFDKGEDGSELYCRWCGQGGQVYCCSDCPVVFCAKCIRRNFGPTKIKEIENADDWKCFKCNDKPLWDLRSICWALLRFCDLKNKITFKTQDPDLKTAYQKSCSLDDSECCKQKLKRKSDHSRKKEEKVKRDSKEDEKAKAVTAMNKLPPAIQVKKLASLLPDEPAKKTPQKRPLSPKNKPTLLKNPVQVSAPKMYYNTNVVSGPSGIQSVKRYRMQNPTVNTMKSPNNTRIRPKPPAAMMPPANNYNGLNNSMHFNPFADNINLSLESLTQGLDIHSGGNFGNNQNDDVVCTPDFPLEPLCEVTEDNGDDDVQCITPTPVASGTPKSAPPPITPRMNASNDFNFENIIQMTNEDVTVNPLTGGLKFRVDPQTLLSNKMYRLPDGRIFAINANPNMPGGYSATIVAVTESTSGKNKDTKFIAKISSVAQTTTTHGKQNRNSVNKDTPNKSVNKETQINSLDKLSKSSGKRSVDMNVPVEWYRYNLLDSIDALEYSLSRLQKLKKDATTMFLRTRTVPEMQHLQRTLDRLLNTSSNRFIEIRHNLSKGLKQYIVKKNSGEISDDDDDVEILPNIDDDPIFIDENSVESNMNDTNCNDNPTIDFTRNTANTNRRHYVKADKPSKERNFASVSRKELLNDTNLSKTPKSMQEDIVVSEIDDNSKDESVKNKSDEKDENAESNSKANNEKEACNPTVNDDVNKEIELKGSNVISEKKDSERNDKMDVDNDNDKGTLDERLNVVENCELEDKSNNGEISKENSDQAVVSPQNKVLNDNTEKETAMSEEMIRDLLKDDDEDDIIFSGTKENDIENSSNA